MYPALPRLAIVVLFAFVYPRVCVAFDAQAPTSITIDLYHSNMTCLAGQSGDITTDVIAESGCQQVALFPNGQYTAPGAFSAKLSSTDPAVVLYLFDDTACTDKTPDTIKSDGGVNCAPQAASGAGWMSYKVEAN